MLNANMLRYTVEGRVLVDPTSTPDHFNGGTPCLNDGTLCGSPDDPDQYVGGLGYVDSGAICARDAFPDGNNDGGLARTGVGSLALDLDGPIVGYYAGLPVTEDGRLACELTVVPPPITGFSDGFSGGFGS